MILVVGSFFLIIFLVDVVESWREVWDGVYVSLSQEVEGGDEDVAD